MSNEPVFFCENCGAEVKDSDARCPNCGKGFAGVKCPRCAHQGTTDDFAEGCPKCHYKMDSEPVFDLPQKGRPLRQPTQLTFPITALVFTLAIIFIIMLYSYAT